MHLVKFGRQIVNMSALLEAEIHSDAVWLYLAGPGFGDGAAFTVKLDGGDKTLFERWLGENSTDAASIYGPVPEAPASAIPHQVDDNIPF